MTFTHLREDNEIDPAQFRNAVVFPHEYARIARGSGPYNNSEIKKIVFIHVS